MIPRYTKYQLEEAVKTSISIRQVSIKIGISPAGGSYEVLRRKFNEWNIDASHIIKCQPNYSKKELNKMVKGSTSILQISIKTGVSYHFLRKKIKQLRIDTSHFIDPFKNYRHNDSKRKKHLNQVLTKNSKYGTNALKLRLVKEGHFIHQCSCCKLTEWRGNPISLELDHINGISNDHRIENLRLLCPNCHAQTDTYRGKNIKKW